MDSNLILANIFRRIARIGSILIVLLTLPFLLFVGLQVFSGEAANPRIFLYLLFLTGVIAGMVIAWRREALGAAITLVSFAGVFILSGGLLPGVGSEQGFAMFAGPINLLFALLIPGYHPDVSPSARLVPVISWFLQIIPVVTFFTSWWLRKAAKSSAAGTSMP